MLSFTPAERLTDREGRPYFLCDCDLTLIQFQRALRDADPGVRAYLVGKLMRQAKPDDVFLFGRPRVIRELWPQLTRRLPAAHRGPVRDAHRHRQHRARPRETIVLRHPFE